MNNKSLLFVYETNLENNNTILENSVLIIFIFFLFFAIKNREQSSHLENLIHMNVEILAKYHLSSEK